MGANIRDLTKKANPASDKVVSIGDDTSNTEDTNSADVLFEEFQENLRVLFRSIWPVKTAQWLALASDLTPRQAARILAREQGVSLKTLWHLTQSEHGQKFHRAYMSSMRGTDWWQKLCASERIAEIKEQQRVLQKDLERELKNLSGGNE